MRDFDRNRNPGMTWRKAAKRKEIAYLRGFHKKARELKIDPHQANFPYSIADDASLGAGDAFELGQADAIAASRKITRLA